MEKDYLCLFGAGVKTTTWFLVFALCFTGCKTEPVDQKEQSSRMKKVSSAAAATLLAGDYWLAGTNNISNKIEVYDQLTYPDLNDPAALKWNWMPATALGYSSTDVNLWTNGDPEGDPMDAKLRNSTYWSGSTQVVVAVGGQLVTVCRYTGGTKGQKLWAANVGAGNYPHSAELLPNGNVVVATSHGNFVRVYDTSGGGGTASYTLAGAHGVLWDPVYNSLWAIGDTKIVRLSVGGTKTAPTLTEVGNKTIPGNGHDISAHITDNSKLLFTNSGSVYIYDKPTNSFTTVPGAANRAAIKSVSNQPSGLIVETKPHGQCTLNSWCTPYIQCYNGTTGSLEVSYLKTGAGFYKADVWCADYGAPVVTTTLNPTADAFMRDGTYGGTNYGTSAALDIKAGGTGFTRQACFKFDVTAITSCAHAKLRVYGSNIESTAGAGIRSYYWINDGWTETGITWDNRQTDPVSVGITTVNSTAKYWEWDVTAYVHAQVAGDNIVSLLLAQVTGTNLTTNWNSREGVNKPQLVITH